MNMMIDIPFSKQFSAYFATSEDGEKHPGIILIHEVWGLNEHIKDVANRFTKEGYIVLAPDLISQTEEAAEDSWKRTLDFLNKYLK